MAEKKVIDWERIAVEYRANVLTLREIAGLHDISEGAIRKKAKKEGWVRDLYARIQAKADSELVRKAAVRNEVRSEDALRTEQEIVDAAAQAIVTVKLEHRTSIRRYKTLLDGLLAELEKQTSDLELYEQLGDLMYKPDDKGVDRLNELYRKVISLPQRTKVIVDLANTLKTLIGLEREAYNIDDSRGEDEADKQQATPVKVVIQVKDASIDPESVT